MLEIIPAKPQRFRTIDRQVFYFPDEINPQDYEVFKFIQGERADNLRGLSKDHFDSIQFVSMSKNANNGKEFIQAIGHRTKDKSFTVLIMRKK